MKFAKKIITALLVLSTLVTSLSMLGSCSDTEPVDGLVPYVGANGNWWTGDTDTGVSAVAYNGTVPFVGENGNWWVGTSDTGIKALGNDGTVPYVGENENWWIGNTDTGVNAKGGKGETGSVGPEGPAGSRGEKGEKGPDGIEGEQGRDGKYGEDGISPLFRYSELAQGLQISYDNGRTWTNLSYQTNSAEVVSYDFPTELIEPLPGTIANASNSYIIVPDPYYGSIIDIQGTVFDSVYLAKNASGCQLGYTFLTDELKLDNIPAYATGYTHVIWNDSDSVTLTIPSDAKYLYVYYMSPGEPSLPSTIRFFKAEKYTVPVDPMTDPNLTSYNFPISKLSILDGTIASYGDQLIKQNKAGKYIVVQDAYYGSMVKIEGCAYDTVTLTKNESGCDLAYAFLSQPLVVNAHPTYATGYTDVIWTNEESVTLTIPDNARYLYVYYESIGDMHIPSSITFSKSGNAPVVNENSIRIATWNIGHFSNGDKPNSTIKDSAFASEEAYYKDYIDYSVNADLIALNEYSALFTPSHATKDSIFSSYENFYEGIQQNYSCNAIYSRIPISNIELHSFESTKDADIHSPYVTAQDYYFLTADITVNGETVKMVFAHLVYDEYNSKANSANIAQIKELIEYCNGYERVVVMGDFNVEVFSDFYNFTNAGYDLAYNDENLYTYSKNTSALDNIIYKGVTVSDFTRAGTDLSDHYAIYCTITVEK